MSSGPVLVSVFHDDVHVAPGGTATSDTGPARDLESEPRHPGLEPPLQGNPILTASLWHDDLWRLRIQRGRAPLSPSSQRRQSQGHATDMSQLPVRERRIPASYF